MSNEDVLPPLELGLDPSTYTLDQLLFRLTEMGASDLHLEAGNPPVMRFKGDIRFSDLPAMSHEHLTGLLSVLPVDERLHERFEKTGNIDFAYELTGVARFRVNWLKQYYGVGCVIRVIPSKIPTLDQLNLPAVLSTLALSPRGIVLVTGPTGSGKSTTLAAMINHVNQTRKAHIITIEDPIEFTHNSSVCLIDHREIGAHTKSFAAALKACLREDPDIVLVGEMRDLETIALALTAAEMGVLVFGTLHTNSAPKTVDRIIDVFPAEQQEQVRMQLSQSLRGVVAQQLLKKADGSGRVAALEIMVVNEGLRALIREGKTAQMSSFIMMGKDEGMQSLDACLIEFVREGRIKLEDALERATDRTAFKRAGLITE
ncbi:MAG: type IV pilus twitching motility protein PilT [Proteobacteria bacterium]|nr:type IV pilus twitching motility protein PilT [Pseudomonadota bacterium]